ncbi:hypothetical protein GFL28_36640, partial [Rhizobium leguminosarum bv. viciae]|nr:hypothetical protein [Rhizobium leguminosarum bv. viciae]
MTSAPTSRAAPPPWKARRRYPGCPDGRLASSAGLGCAPLGEWETGSRTPLCDRSPRHQVTHWRLVQEPKDSKAICPAERETLPIGANAGQNLTEPKEKPPN